MLDASIQLLEEKGFDAFTVQDVSQRADVSVGAIYARFGNKESLLRAVHGRAMDVARSASTPPSRRSTAGSRQRRGDRSSTQCGTSHEVFRRETEISSGRSCTSARSTT